MIELRPGDVFVTKNPAPIGRAINKIQALVSRDGRSVYSHAGIILDSKGTTLESLWRCKRQNLFKAYAGKPVCIARWPGISDVQYESALQAIQGKYEGRRYPIWRLLFHMIPVIARHISAGGRFVVCSELVARFLFQLRLQGGYKDAAGYNWPRHKYFCGTNPDMLADEWHRWHGYEIVFEGILPAKIKDEEGKT